MSFAKLLCVAAGLPCYAAVRLRQPRYDVADPRRLTHAVPPAAPESQHLMHFRENIGLSIYRFFTRDAA